MNFNSILSGDTKFSSLRNLCDSSNIEFLNMREQSTNGVVACRFTRGETSIDIRMVESDYFRDLEDTERRLILIVGAVFETYKDKEDMFNDISLL